jgi:hypothetical protein
MAKEKKKQKEEQNYIYGDASWCKVCESHTVYANTGCAVCAVPTGEFRARYSGRFWMK